jgi:CheY-like chemotaxis protein
MNREVPEALESEWQAFDAALRELNAAPVPAALRDRCLPPGQGDAPSWRILVVDDEPAIRRLVTVNLERAGYAVRQAADGEAALEELEGSHPDLIVLDVFMPGPNGFRILEILKSDPRLASIPVLMLTAASCDDHVRRSMVTGADFHMTKPFNPADLLFVVERMLAALGAPEAPPPVRNWQK